MYGVSSKQAPFFTPWKKPLRFRKLIRHFPQKGNINEYRFISRSGRHSRVGGLFSDTGYIPRCLSLLQNLKSLFGFLLWPERCHGFSLGTVLTYLLRSQCFAVILGRCGLDPAKIRLKGMGIVWCFITVCCIFAVPFISSTDSYSEECRGVEQSGYSLGMARDRDFFAVSSVQRNWGYSVLPFWISACIHWILLIILLRKFYMVIVIIEVRCGSYCLAVLWIAGVCVEFESGK